MLDVSDLHMVESICQTGSITQAAESLHISQPTLSKRLARLEQQLGASLFHRSARGLTPTPIANYLIEQSAAIKAQVSSVERQVRRLVDRDAGELRIGVGPIIEQVLLPQTLIQLRSKTGNVRFSVLTEHADVLMARLEAGDLDVVAGPFSADWQDIKERGLIAVDLIQEPTINVARPDHPILQVKDPDFLSYPYASPPLQGAVESEADESRPRPRLVSENYALLKRVALASDYILGGPRAVFEPEIKAGLLAEVPGFPAASWRSACLCKAEAAETSLVQLFIQTIIACRDDYQSDR